MASKKVKNIKGVTFETNILTSISNDIKRTRTYLTLLNNLEQTMFSNIKLIHRKIYVILDDGSRYAMNLSAFYVNLVLWAFNLKFRVPITKDDVHDFTDINYGYYIKVMNKIISKFINMGFNLNDNTIIAFTKEKIVNIANNYGIIVSNTFSLYDLMALENRSKIFAEIFNTELSDDTPYTTIEQFIKIAKFTVYDAIMEDKRSSIYPYIKTGVLSPIQLSQAMVAVGLRPDIDKSILPRVVSNNWIHGLTSVSQFYVESVANRNAIIVKKDQVPNAGYLSRKVNIACLSTTLNSKIFDCGSRHHLSYFVKDENHLKIIEGKYRLIDNKGPKYKEVSLTDTDLIGKTIQLRSHTKCITGHKFGEVCCVCLGNKHKSLNDARIGGLVSFKFINKLSQLAMSAKHAIETNSSEIQDEFINRLFLIDNASLYPNSYLLDHNTDIKILISTDIVNNIMSSDVIDDSGLDFSKILDSLYILKDGELSGINLEDKMYFLNISEYLMKIINKSDKIEVIKYSEISVVNEIIDGDTNEIPEEFIIIDKDVFMQEQPLFNVKILTEEVTKHLNATKNIIDGRRTLSYSRPEEPIMDLVDVIIKVGLNLDGIMIHLETLLLNLMRVDDDAIDKPDYSQKNEPKVQFIKLSQVIKKSDLFSGMVYQHIKFQLADPDTLRKGSPGVYDPFFMNDEFLKPLRM